MCSSLSSCHYTHLEEAVVGGEHEGEADGTIEDVSEGQVDDEHRVGGHVLDVPVRKLRVNSLPLQVEATLSEKATNK